MLTAIILICSLTATPDLHDCTPATAHDIMHTPVASFMPTTCYLQGQAFLAQMQLGRDLRSDEVTRIICQRRRG